MCGNEMEPKGRRRNPKSSRPTDAMCLCVCVCEVRDRGAMDIGWIFDLGAREIEPHTPSDTPPIPHARPVAPLHQPPDLLQHLGNAIAIPESGVSTNCSDCGSDPIALGGSEACAADDETGHQKQGLNGVAGLERIQDGQ